MGRTTVLTATAVVLIAAGLTTWVVAADTRASIPAGDYEPRPRAKWLLTPEHGDSIRDDAFKRAAVRLRPAPTERERVGRQPPAHENTPLPDLVTCRFLRTEPSGTTPKFSCVLDGGEVVRVKYGRNSEIHAEALASRVLTALGFGADDVSIVPRLRCDGCPRYPFLASRVLSLAHAMNRLAPNGDDDGYTDFEWASVERKFDAPAIETEQREGWGWWELKHSLAPRADLDAFRLMAVFLAHWDNKDENQRIVCLDDPASVPDQRCERPLLMMNDLGATFGPFKLNLARWRGHPIWLDRGTCTVSMHGLPFQGATFPDARISEEGRIQLARTLAALSPDTIREWLTAARVPAFYSATDDTRDVEVWLAAFRERIDQIVSAGPCETGSIPFRPSRDSSSES